MSDESARGFGQRRGAERRGGEGRGGVVWGGAVRGGGGDDVGALTVRLLRRGDGNDSGKQDRNIKYFVYV